MISSKKLLDFIMEIFSFERRIIDEVVIDEIKYKGLVYPEDEYSHDIKELDMKFKINKKKKQSVPEIIDIFNILEINTNEINADMDELKLNDMIKKILNSSKKNTNYSFTGESGLFHLFLRSIILIIYNMKFNDYSKFEKYDEYTKTIYLILSKKINIDNIGYINNIFSGWEHIDFEENIINDTFNLKKMITFSSIANKLERRFTITDDRIIEIIKLLYLACSTCINNPQNIMNKILNSIKSMKH